MAVRRVKNPVPESRPDLSAFPHLSPSYPVKPWVDMASGVSYQTAAVRQEDGRYVAIIVQEPSIRAVAGTQKAAEEAVKRKAAEIVRNPTYLSEEREDKTDMDFYKQMEARWKKRGAIPLDTVRRRLGR